MQSAYFMAHLHCCTVPVPAVAAAKWGRTLTSQRVVVVVFFTLLTDRASTVPSNIRGCQSGTWSAGQKNIRGTSTKLQREQNKTKQNRNDKKKGTITKYTCQKKKEKGHSIERVWYNASREPSDILPGSQSCTRTRSVYHAPHSQGFSLL